MLQTSHKWDVRPSQVGVDCEECHLGSEYSSSGQEPLADYEMAVVATGGVAALFRTRRRPRCSFEMMRFAEQDSFAEREKQLSLLKRTYHID